MNERIIYITAPTEDVAEALVRSLLEERLIACANIIPGVRSLYRWQGKINDEPEVIILAKTMERLVENVTTKVNELHPYDCPCSVSLEIKEGNPAFLSWLNEECGEA